VPFVQICDPRAGRARAATSIPRVSPAAAQVVGRAPSADGVAAAAVAEIGSVPSDHEQHVDAVPRSPADPVRLRQAAVVGPPAEKAQVRESPSPHIHANDEDAGRAGGLPQFPRTHISATGRHHQGGSTSGIAIY